MCIYSTYACICVCIYICLYIYTHYICTVYKSKTFVHPDRKGETAQVSVSYHIADKPGGVLSDAAMLTAQAKQMQSFVVYPLAGFLRNVFI